jgi:excisionase family DNA binding protein
MEHALLTVGECAEELRVAVSTIRKWVFQKRLVGVKIGRRLLFRREDVDGVVVHGLAPVQVKSR